MAKLIAVVPVTDNEIGLLSMQRHSPTEWAISITYRTLDSDGALVSERTASAGSLSADAVAAFATFRAEMLTAINAAEGLTDVPQVTLDSLKVLKAEAEIEEAAKAEDAAVAVEQ